MVGSAIDSFDAYIKQLDSWVSEEQKPLFSSKWQKFFNLNMRNINVSYRHMRGLERRFSGANNITSNIKIISKRVAEEIECFKGNSTVARGNKIMQVSMELSASLKKATKVFNKFFRTAESIILQEIDNVRLFAGKDNEKKLGELFAELEKALQLILDKRVIQKIKEASHNFGKVNVSVLEVAAGNTLEEKTLELDAEDILRRAQNIVKEILKICEDIDESTLAFVNKTLQQFRSQHITLRAGVAKDLADFRQNVVSSVGRIVSSVDKHEAERKKLTDMQYMLGEKLGYLNVNVKSLITHLHELQQVLAKDSNVSEGFFKNMVGWGKLTGVRLGHLADGGDFSNMKRAVQSAFGDTVAKVHGIIVAVADVTKNIELFHRLLHIRLVMAQQLLANSVAILFYLELENQEVRESLNELAAGDKLKNFYLSLHTQLQKAAAAAVKELMETIEQFNAQVQKEQLEIDNRLRARFMRWAATVKRDHKRLFVLSSILISAGSLKAQSIDRATRLAAEAFDRTVAEPVIRSVRQAAEQAVSSGGDVVAQAVPDVAQAAGQTTEEVAKVIVHNAEAAAEKTGVVKDIFSGRGVGEGAHFAETARNVGHEIVSKVSGVNDQLTTITELTKTTLQTADKKFEVVQRVVREAINLKKSGVDPQVIIEGMKSGLHQVGVTITDPNVIENILKFRGEVGVHKTILQQAVVKFGRFFIMP